MAHTINIAEDYTPYLGGRYEEDGDGNGTTFRKKFLVPQLKSETTTVRVVLDGAAGYPSSFLEEAFGGLVREEGFAADVLLAKLRFIAEKPGFSRFILQIEDYIKNAKPKARA